MRILIILLLAFLVNEASARSPIVYGQSAGGATCAYDLISRSCIGGFTNPMTSSGDIIYGGASGAATRLAKGSDGECLVLASGVPDWGSCGTGASSGAAGSVQLSDGSNGFTSEATLLFWSTANNRLGIGTNSPQRDLHISSTGEPTLMFSQSGNAADTKHWQYTVSGGHWYVQALNDLLQGDTAIVANRNSSGATNVEIYNTLRIPDYGNGTLSVSSGNVTSSSDVRMKDVLRPFERGTEAVKGINPQIYKWKAGTKMASDFEHAGFIAQNIESVIPEAVTMGPDGMRSLDTVTVIAALVNAVKELDQRCPPAVTPKPAIPLKPIQVMPVINKNDPKRNPGRVAQPASKSAK